MAAITASKIDYDFDNIVWGDVTNADTITPARVEGGIYTCEVSGTLDGATVQWLWGSTAASVAPVGLDEVPYGGKVSTGTVRSVNLTVASGYIGATVTGGGGTQNLTLTAIKMRE